MPDTVSIADAPVFPPMVVVALTNACDYACVHCFHRIYVRQPDYVHQDMPFAIFQRIIAELRQHPGAALRLIAWGEPLLHPQLAEFVAHGRARAPENPITLITNGYHLTPSLSLALMQGGLDLVEISVDAVSAQAYRRVRVGPCRAAFETVCTNVRALIRQRDAGGFKTRVAVSYIVWPDAESEAEYAAFAAQWRGVADEVVQRRLHSFKGAVAAAVPPSGPRLPCRGLWARCNINPWGEISVCYNDWENRHVVADLRQPDATIALAWRGEVLERYRAGQRAGVFEGICADCRDYNPDAWQQPYENVIARCQVQ
jgi:hypothetical protein